CIVSLLLLLGPWAVSQAQELPPEIVQYADMVLHNGTVLPRDRDQPPITVSQAVALRNGRVLAVGENDRILQMAGPNTVRVDLGGKTVIPGIIDTHSHPNRYALTHYDDEVTPLYLKSLEERNVMFATLRWDTKETVLADFEKFMSGVSPGQWIYTTTQLNQPIIHELTRYDLDKFSPNNPFYAKVGNAWFGLVNTPMLEIMIETYGENLPGILKDEQGVPTGRLFGTASTVVDQNLLPQMPPEIIAPVFTKELQEWVAMGVTTLSTRLRGTEITAHGLMEQRGELPLRIGYSHEMGRWNPAVERQLKRFGNLQGHGTDRLWLIGISVGISDGNGPPKEGGYGGDTCTTLTKRVILPGDLFPEGKCYWEQPSDLSRETVLAASRMGYRIAGTHTLGDKGFLLVLDAFATANQESSILDRRFALEHGMMVSPEVVRKSAELGVIWSLQPPLFYGRFAAAVSRVFGEEYAHRWVLPVKSLIDAGARVTYGADTHSDPQRQPLFNLEVMITRRTSDGRVFGPREAIDRSTALLMMTRWGADYVLREDILGSLEPGKLADLAVLDKNPLDPSIADEDLSEINVVATIIDGKVVAGSLN
ncbi:MAG: amidohydrolase family protein, partial [Acidobacteriota bacterium]